MKLKHLIPAIALAGSSAHAELPVPVYKVYQEPSTTQVFITVHWVADPDTVCKEKAPEALSLSMVYGCAQYNPALGSCEIYLKQPDDFNDRFALMTLGHEVHHCLGAKHR